MRSIRSAAAGTRWLVVLAIVAAMGGWLFGQSTSKDVRLTLTEGTSMAAAVSPDGKVLAIDLLGALWTLGADGGPARRILEDGYDARMPAWSPDGRRLAFQAYHRDTWHIWIVNADGTGLQEVTSGPFDDREPHWSPDGTRLAFSSDRSGNYDVWILTLASGEIRRLTTNAANDSMPAWSPDGREMAFVSDRAERGIYAQAVNAATDRLVVADATTLFTPAWTPDGKTVAYVSVSGAVSQLKVGGAAVSDAAEDVFPFRPQWVGANELLYTADGVIKRRPRAGGQPRTVPFTAEVAFTRPAFTPKRHVFTPEGPQPVRGLMHPVIAPDGSRVAFAALGDLWTVSARGGDAVPERLTQDVYVEMNPAWSPDGTQLAFSSDRGGAMDVWIRDLRTGRDRRLASGGDVGDLVARRLAARLSRSAVPAPRRRRVERRGPPGSRTVERARAPELVAGWPRGGDVRAAPVLDALSRGHQPGAVGAGGAGSLTDRTRRVLAGSLVRSAAAQVDRHAREPRAGVVA